MNPTLRDPLSPAALTLYVDGDLSPDERAAIERALVSSAEARRHVDELRRVRDVLVAPQPQLDGIDVAAGVRTALARSPAPTMSRARRAVPWKWPMLGLAVVAAGVSIVAWMPGRSVGPLSGAVDDQFVAKAAAPAGARDSWAGIRVYRESAGPNLPPLPLQGVLSSGTGLLFTYTNLGPQPFAHLMVFARDAAGEVRWFFPVWARASEDPGSITIRPGAADVSLGELVRQPFQPGPLTIYALFSRTPLHVRQVEAWLATAPSPATPAVPWPDTHLLQVSAVVAGHRPETP